MHTLILIYLVLYIVPAFMLDYLQKRYIQRFKDKEAVILNSGEYKQAAEYGIIQRNISMVGHIVDAIIFSCWIIFGLNYLNALTMSWNLPGHLNELFMVLIFFGVNFILNIPHTLYSRGVDKRFGFNKDNTKLFIVDMIKTLTLSAVIISLIVYAILFMMDNLEFWWLYSFILMIAVSVIANLIYPTIIAPLFNEFKPLQDEELKNRIHDLMISTGFKSSGIFVMDASKRDGRLNAYFGGFGKSKRVVLFDTLIDKVSKDGLIAILGHELGHFKHKDIIKNLFIGGVFLFILFYGMGNIVPSLGEMIGISAGDAGIIILALMIFPIVSFLLNPITNYFSRRAEYRADEFGASCVSKKALREALIRLVNENKSFPHSHPAYTFFYFSHPPLFDRLKTLNE